MSVEERKRLAERREQTQQCRPNPFHIHISLKQKLGMPTIMI